MHKNLKVTFELGSEMIVPVYPIAFDALLMKAAATKEGWNPEEEAESRSSPEIPVERHPLTSLYMASVGFIRYAGRSSQFYTKCYPGDRPPNISRTGGYYKPYHQILYTLACPGSVTFFCRADPVKLEELLPYIPALGSKRAHGYGRVAGYRIEELEEDRSFIYQDQPMRAIPVRYYRNKLNEWYYSLAAPVPPSYAAGNKELCYLPRPGRWLVRTDTADRNERQDEEWSSTRIRPAPGSKRGFRKLWNELEGE
jgi:hypothetical protein